MRSSGFPGFPRDRSVFSRFAGEYRDTAITGKVRKKQKYSLIGEEMVNKVVAHGHHSTERQGYSIFGRVQSAYPERA